MRSPNSRRIKGSGAAALALAILWFSACAADQGQDRTSGAFACPTCDTTQEWFIDENHVLYWDDAPYIPHALMGLEYEHFTTIEKDRQKIDRRIQDGITGFAVQYQMDLDRIARDEGLDISEDIAARNRWFDEITDHIASRGGTYIFYHRPLPPRAGIAPDVSWLKQEATKKAALDELRQVMPLVAKDGLRAVIFFWEINSEGVLPPPEEGVGEFKETLNHYAKMVKDEVGNVPLLLRMARHSAYRPYVAAMTGEHVDGVVAEYSGHTPDDVRQMMSDSPYLRYFNSAPSTKLFWINSQVQVGGTHPPFVSYDVMWDSHRATAENGATGSVLDMYNYEWAGIDEAALADTYRWYGQFKSPFGDLVLQKAEEEEFVSGRYAALDDLDFAYPEPQSTPDVIISAVQHDPAVALLINTYPCLSVQDPSFAEEGSGDWNVEISIPDLGDGGDWAEISVEVSDATNEITRNSILLGQQAAVLGYENPTKDLLAKRGCK